MKEMSFEEAMEKLEQTTKELESGELDLNSSMEKFEEGIKLSKKCNEILESAQKKITILISNDGELKEEEFEAK